MDAPPRMNAIDARLVALTWPFSQLSTSSSRRIVNCFFAGGQGIVAFLKKVLSSRGMSESSSDLKRHSSTPFCRAESSDEVHRSFVGEPPLPQGFPFPYRQSTTLKSR